MKSVPETQPSVFRQRRGVPSHHSVCIHKHTFGVVCELPAVKLSEGHAQVWSLHHGQVRRVPTVHHVHQPDLIVQRLKHCPEKDEIELGQPHHWKPTPI